MQWPAGFANVTHYFTIAGDGEFMLTSVGISGTGLPGNAVAVANLFMEAWDEELKSIFSTDTTLDHVEVAVGPSSAPIRQDSTSGPFFGTNPSGVLLPNTALLVKKRTERGGRAGRGRMYWPGFGDVTNVEGNGVILSGALASYQELFENWQEHLLAHVGPGAFGEMYLFHSTELAPDDIESFTVDARLATQRRRLRP